MHFDNSNIPTTVKSRSCLEHQKQCHIQLDWIVKNGDICNLIGSYNHKLCFWWFPLNSSTTATLTQTNEWILGIYIKISTIWYIHIWSVGPSFPWNPQFIIYPLLHCLCAQDSKWCLLGPLYLHWGPLINWHMMFP